MDEYWDALLDGPVHCPDCGRIECAAKRESVEGCGEGFVSLVILDDGRAEWVPAQQARKAATERQHDKPLQPATEADYNPTDLPTDAARRVNLLELITGQRLTAGLVVADELLDTTIRCMACREHGRLCTMVEHALFWKCPTCGAEVPA